MIELVSMAVKRCTCGLCGHVWHSIAEHAPAACPKCVSREWNGPKPNGRPPNPRDTSKHGLPKPQRVRSL